MTSTERRNYFRVNSELTLKYVSVSAHTVENSLPEDLFPDHQYASQLIHELQRLDHELQPHLYSLTELNRTLGDCLQVLNRKIDLVARHSASVLGNLSSTGSNPPAPVPVNISEGGLAFPSDTPHKVGDYLGLHLQFIDTYAAVIGFAVVRRCQRSSDNQSWTVACEFHQLAQKAQELVRRHVMQEQLKAIRQQKQTREPPQ